MSAFRSLQIRYQQEEEQNAILPWPAVYRRPLPEGQAGEYALQVRIENQLPQTLNRRQLATMPSFTESRRIVSKAGWTYYAQWKGLTFQTLFNLFSSPQLYPWVRLESMNGDVYVLERASLANHRIVLSCDDKELPAIYGGPLWIHNFDQYVEYAIPHIKAIILLQGEHEPCHPASEYGFRPEQARIVPGTYYDIYHERVTTL